MTSGHDLRPSLKLAAVCVGFAAVAPVALAQSVTEWGLAPLMHELSDVHSATARFAERSTVPLLSTPLLSSGSLTYVAPSYVRKTTTMPPGQDFILDGDQVTVTGAGQPTRQVSLAAAPQIAGLVEGVRATLAGDLPTLERFYLVRLTGTQPRWQLLLRPKDAGLRHFLTWMLIQGSANRIMAVDTQGAGGDHTETGIDEDVGDAR